ncbi:ABC transporter ATP-binding protein [Gammaproteobacteria bacterium]|nr:ABC transporter ATP-binding protein [Gammaproteobacteria bacterium]
MNAQPQALNVISLAGVSKRYGNVDVLRDLDLTVQRGAIHGLVGLNGSGKTTTLECILGLQQVHSGSASILGFEPRDLYRAEGDVVAVFDTPSLHANLTVRQTLSHAAHLIPAQKKPSASGVKPPRSVNEVMSLLGLSRYASFKIRSLSLGNRRRASIAHALLGNPKLVLLDEPFNGLDAGGVDEVLALIKTLNRDFGTSFLLSSHQLPYLQSVCSHLSILHDGHIVASGSLEELLQGSDAKLIVRTPDIARAQALLEKLDGILSVVSDTGSLTVTLATAKPAAVNQALVSVGIPVDELVHVRASVESLFRELTSASTDKSNSRAIAS